MEYNTIIIEDDVVSCLLLEHYCSNVPTIKLLESFETLEEAIAYSNNTKVNLVFLDVELKDGLAWRFFEKAPPNTKVVITTGSKKHAEIAREKFKVGNILLKPIKLADFLQVVTSL